MIRTPVLARAAAKRLTASMRRARNAYDEIVQSAYQAREAAKRAAWAAFEADADYDDEVVRTIRLARANNVARATFDAAVKSAQEYYKANYDAAYAAELKAQKE